MALKKQQFAEGEIAIFDEACIYKRGEYWQFRMWLPKENKYARKSLRTRKEDGKARNKDSHTHCRGSKDEDSNATTTAANRT